MFLVDNESGTFFSGVFSNNPSENENKEAIEEISQDQILYKQINREIHKRIV
jgi:hypothetical protein